MNSTIIIQGLIDGVLVGGVYAAIGLGLSLARRIVDLCGGTIEVHSRVGEGTAFIVKLTDGK